MYKIIEYHYGDSDRNEPFVLLSSENMHKTAEYAPEILEYLEHLEKKIDKTYALVNALSAGEFYGSNRNGDYFPEMALQAYHKTFEAMAHVYKHHINKDPRKSFGRVVFSNYNPRMHRVELVIELDNRRAKDIIEKANSSISDVKVSMGCKVPFDVCSVCGNRAKKISNYCDHLKTSMGRILGDGRRVYAINTMPKFFDLSIVAIPADRTAGFLAKVASDETTIVVPSAQIALDFLKEGDLESRADIKKEIIGKIDGISPDPRNIILKTQRSLKKETLEKLSKYPLNEVLSTMAGLRILPKKNDFMKMALYSTGHKNFANDLARTKDFDYDVQESILPSDVSLTYFNEKVAELLAPEIPELSLTKPFIIARAMEKTAEDVSDHSLSSKEVFEKYGFDEPTYDPQIPSNPSKLQEILIGHTPDPKLSPSKNPIVPLAVLGGL